MRRIFSPGLIFVFTVTVIFFSSFPREDNRQLPGFALEPAGGFSLPQAVAGEAPLLPSPGDPVPSMTEREERQPSSEELEKISISYGLEKEILTIQAASYPDVASAKRGYALLEHDLPSKELDLLRIEVVGPYHTLRLGAFENGASAQSLLRKVKKIFPSALVLSAYIKPARIVIIYEHPQAPEEAPEEESSGPGEVAAVRSGAPEPPVGEEGAGVTPPVQLPEVMESVRAESEQNAKQREPSPEGAGQSRTEATKSIPPIEEKRELNKPIVLPKNLSFKTIKIFDRDDRANPLRYPSTVFYDRTMREIYVIDSGRVLIFDADYTMLVSFGKGRGVAAPQGLYVDSDGRVYVCQSRDGDKPPRLTILNPALFVEKEIFLNSIAGAESFTPERIARSHDGTLYLVGPNTLPGVLVLDSQGNFLRWLRAGDSEPGESAGVPRKPVSIKDIDIDDQGRIYLLSEDTSKIYVYSPDEKFLFSFGQKGGSSGKTSRPRGLALDSDRRIIYVVDYMRHTVLVYDFNGTYLAEFGGLGYSAGWFYYPTDIAVDETGRPIVADFFNHRVQILEMEVHD
jgi:DNA-binding beta-propeller fold protein YncE